MEKMRLLIVLGLAVLMLECAQNKEQDSKMAMNEYVVNAVERFNFSSYEIGKDEVRDTSFVLPRDILDDPMAFMKIITDVQMIGCVWTDVCDYPEKLQYGDSILRNICNALSDSGGVPMYLVEEIYCAETATYILSMKKKGVSSYSVYDSKSTYKYDVTDRHITYEHENIWPISKSFR